MSGQWRGHFQLVEKVEVQSVTVGFKRFKESLGFRNGSREVVMPLTHMWNVAAEEEHLWRRSVNISTCRWRILRCLSYSSEESGWLGCYLYFGRKQK